MTVEFLAVLTCWPNTARPAHALAYLRARRARMARQALRFYQLPRQPRWLLAGTDRVQSLLAFAVTAPAIDEKASQAWRKVLIALNEVVKPPEGTVVEPHEGRGKRQDAASLASAGATPCPRRNKYPSHDAEERSHKRLKFEEPWARASDYSPWPVRWRNWQRSWSASANWHRGWAAN
jgi:hypothetical protein